MKSIKIIAAVVTFCFATVSFAESESSLNHDEKLTKSFFIGSGINVDSYTFEATNYGVALWQLHAGVSFLVFQKNGYEIEIGPHFNFSGGRAGFLTEAHFHFSPGHAWDLSVATAVTVYAKTLWGGMLAFAGGGGAGFFAQGISLGLLPGVKLNFSKRLALFTEVGIVNRFVFRSNPTNLVTGALHAGISFSF